MSTLLLPGFEPRGRRCDLCGTVAPLGQWSPFRAFLLCRACTEANPFPLRAYETMHERGQGLTADEYNAREWVAGMEEAIRQAKASRKKPRRVVVTHFSPDVKRRQLSMPVCGRCGGVHSHWVISDYSDRCLRCEAMDKVDTLMRMPKLLELHAGSADDEDILDWMYKRDPAWFDGCDEYAPFMPEYYWGLKVAARAEKG